MEIRDQILAHKWKECKKCQGRGWFACDGINYSPMRRNCEDCFGSCYQPLPIENPEIECESCEGFTKVWLQDENRHLNCFTCQGTGKTTKYNAQHCTESHLSAK